MSGSSSRHSGAAGPDGSRTGDDPSASTGYTDEDREFLRQVYEGAAGAGLQIIGISEIVSIEDHRIGRTLVPVVLGKSVRLRVRIDEAGQLLPRHGVDAAKATSILELEVAPDVTAHGDGTITVVWEASAKQYDTASAQLIDGSTSGPSSDEWEDRIGGRAAREYLEDPELRDWAVESMAKSPAEATRQALAPLVGGANRLRIGKLPQPRSEGRQAARSIAKIIVGGALLLVVVALGVSVLLGSGRPWIGAGPGTTVSSTNVPQSPEPLVTVRTTADGEQFLAVQFVDQAPNDDCPSQHVRVAPNLDGVRSFQAPDVVRPDVESGCGWGTDATFPRSEQQIPRDLFDAFCAAHRSAYPGREDQVTAVCSAHGA